MDDTEPQMWTISEESMRDALREVEVDEPKRFVCPCGRAACQTYVLYGISRVSERMMENIKLSPEEQILPRVGDPVLWLLISISWSSSFSRVVGLTAHDKPRDLAKKLPEDAPAVAYAILLVGGLEQALNEKW